MIAFTAIWLLLGLIAIIVLLVLSIVKKVKWKYFFLSLICYVFLSFIFLVTAGSKPNTSANDASSQSSDPTAKIFKLVYNDDEVYSDGVRFDSNKNGEYTVKFKALQNGKVKLENADDTQNKFKTKTFNVKKGQTVRVPITLTGEDLVHDFELVDNNDNTKEFSIYNNSEAADSIASSMSESESLDSQNDSSSDSTSDSSTTTKYPHYKSNQKVASAINDDFSNSGVDHLENTHVKYKDSIFYVSVPDDVAISTNNEQKEYYEKIARAIHSYQKQPTGVIYFEDQQGNIVATTKVLNNNEVKLK